MLGAKFVTRHCRIIYRQPSSPTLSVQVANFLLIIFRWVVDSGVVVTISVGFDAGSSFLGRNFCRWLTNRTTRGRRRCAARTRCPTIQIQYGPARGPGGRLQRPPRSSRYDPVEFSLVGSILLVERPYAIYLLCCNSVLADSRAIFSVMFLEMVSCSG
uniref:Uncharacterized protein n=1 Tax=Aegilops tauschii subsp. strangulata TaxID=200361 RepID=A0A453G736_AEGTS